MEQYDPQEYWNNRLTRDFSLAGVGFLGLGLEYNKWLYRARLRALARLLKEHGIDPGKKRILDIGVGTGFYLDFWEKTGAKAIVGLDVSEKSIAELKAKYRYHKFVKQDISEPGILGGEKYDIITAFDVLFHIVDEVKFEEALKNIRNWSHNTTKIIVSDSFLRKSRSPAFYEKDRTLLRYKEVFNAIELEIVDLQPIFYLANNPIDIDVIRKKYLHFLLPKIWKFNGKCLRFGQRLGSFGRAGNYFLGMLIYFIDGIILKYAESGPSTKLLLAHVRQENKG
jgi:SAM-dependent methyltransferase